MAAGTVIIDMAAANGGNCAFTEKDKTVIKHGVVLVGNTNLLALMPSDSSNFFGRNLVNIMELMIPAEEPLAVKYDLEDEIITASLVTHEGAVRFKKK
jgi:NAD(P) transhydrogenase subunit alpha